MRQTEQRHQGVCFVVLGQKLRMFPCNLSPCRMSYLGYKRYNPGILSSKLYRLYSMETSKYMKLLFVAVCVFAFCDNKNILQIFFGTRLGMT